MGAMMGRRKKRGQAAYRSGFAISYARFSPRPNSDDCESDVRQLDMCRDYCAQHNLIIRPDCEFSDAAKSGGDDSRAGLLAAYEALRPGDVLVAYSLDRLWRKLETALRFQRKILKKGCFIAAANGDPIEIETPWGRCIARMVAALDELNRENIGRTTSSHRLKMHEQRRAASKDAPYGWRIDRPDGSTSYSNCALLPHPTEQAALVRFFELLASGVSRAELRETLVREGHQQRNGKPFSWEYLHRLEDRGATMIATAEELASVNVQTA